MFCIYTKGSVLARPTHTISVRFPSSFLTPLNKPSHEYHGVHFKTISPSTLQRSGAYEAISIDTFVWLTIQQIDRSADTVDNTLQVLLSGILLQGGRMWSVRLSLENREAWFQCLRHVLSSLSVGHLKT